MAEDTEDEMSEQLINEILSVEIQKFLDEQENEDLKFEPKKRSKKQLNKNDFNSKFDQMDFDLDFNGARNFDDSFRSPQDIDFLDQDLADVKDQFGNEDLGDLLSQLDGKHLFMIPE